MFGNNKRDDDFSSMDFYRETEGIDPRMEKPQPVKKPIPVPGNELLNRLNSQTRAVSEVVSEEPVIETDGISLEEAVYQRKIERRTGILIGIALAVGAGVIYTLIT